MQGSRWLLFSAVLLLTVATALATHSDDEMLQENEIDIDRDMSSKDDLDLQTIKQLIYADRNKNREPVILPEERTKRDLRNKLKQKFKKVQEKVKQIGGKVKNFFQPHGVPKLI